MTRKPSSDITIQVSIEGFPDSTVIEIKTSGGDDHLRADVVEMVLLHLNGLWMELTDRIKAVEVQDIRQHRGLRA
jgi:hypothetical protein